MPINTPSVPSDLVAVFAYTKRGRGYRKVRVSNYVTWDRATDINERLMRFDASASEPMLSAGGGPVLYTVVKSKDDPAWNRSARATAVIRKKRTNVKRALA